MASSSSDFVLMKQLKEELSSSQLQQFMMLYPPRKKSVALGVLLALLLGLLGVHKFYLGNTTSGVVYLLCGTIGWLLIIPPIIIGFMCIIDACQMGSLVQSANNSAAMSLKEELKLLAS